MPSINVFNSDRYIIVAEVNSESYKLFQIAFSNKDASLFVTFPYLKDCFGRAGLMKMPPGGSHFANFLVGDDFPVTSHLVKYSHHPSGRAHFSLTNKVRTSVKKDSVPLSQARGHIFTARFQGITLYEKLEREKKSTPKRGIVPFNFKANNVESIKFVCYFYSEQELLKRMPKGNNSPWVLTVTPDGKTAVGIPLATPFVFQGERRYMILTAESTGYLFTNIEKGFSFMGGFDCEEIVHDYSKETSCLKMFVHPINNFEELESTIGTIDL